MSDLPEAARIVRLAFGTFIGVPDPENFWNDRDYVYGRHRAAHVASFGAKLDGQLVGSNFATRWGTVGFFGPLTVRPELQERGVARALLARTMEQFDSWGTRHVGLSPSRRARNTSPSIRSTAFPRASSPRSCRRRLRRDEERPAGRVSAS
jgi:GNAT superfamily N-acetyltransferase